MKNIKPFLAVLSFFSPVVYAQNVEQKGEGVSKMNLCSNIEWKAEMQGTFSKGKTPLWLNANKHGLSSLEECNGYLRGSLVRPYGIRFSPSLGCRLWLGYCCSG